VSLPTNHPLHNTMPPSDENTATDGGMSSIPPTTNDARDLVLQDLCRHLTGRTTTEATEATEEKNNSIEHRSVVALPVAAIQSLLDVIRRTKAGTMMGLQEELRRAEEDMLEFARSPSSRSILKGGRSFIALASGCELFMKYVTRAFLETPDFAACIAEVLERGEAFANISLSARDRIADIGQDFVQDGQTVVTHGWSRVVSKLLLKAAEHKQFSIVVLEGRPDAGGAKAAKTYAEAGIPTTVVLDSAMAYVIEKADLVIVGAEGVVENGGVVNKVGTYSLGIVAREMGKPFYVAAESYKFARLFPLNQSDLPDVGVVPRLNFVDTASWEATGGKVGKPAESLSTDGAVPGHVCLPDQVEVENPPCDYTPAKYITLLFTDLGVLTPSAVSDELIRLYQ